MIRNTSCLLKIANYLYSNICEKKGRKNHAELQKESGDTGEVGRREMLPLLIEKFQLQQESPPFLCLLINKLSLVKAISVIMCMIYS